MTRFRVRANRTGLMLHERMTCSPFRVALALGSNLGDRQAHLDAARRALSAFVTVEAFSPLYMTAPAYVTDQPAFLNAAAVGTTALAPRELLERLKAVERAEGRVPGGERYGPRVLDVDLIFYGDQVWAEGDLIVPHPRLAERSFVLRPLADLAPDWCHPLTGLTVRAMLAALPDADAPQRQDSARTLQRGTDS